MRRVAVIGIVLASLLLAGAAVYVWAAEPEIEPIARPEPAAIDPGLVDAGARIAAVGNCIACHTIHGGQAFAGGLPLPTPFGTVYSTNITPDLVHGIGNWSLAAFTRALRQGVHRDGRHLYPAFPYDHYTLVTDADVEALYAYLMTRSPVASGVPDNELSFPFNIRLLLAGWKLLYLDEGQFQPNPARDAVWNRGAYLAEGLGHCGACHTPRNALGARDMDRKWAGGEAEGWTAYAINAQSPAPIPWDATQLAFYLRNGWHPAHGVARGPMAEVTGNLGRLPDEDIEAIAVYTASIMGEPTPERHARGAALMELVASGGSGQAADTQIIPVAQAATRGAAIHASACATCHESGRPLPYGALDFRLSTAIHADDPQNIVNVTLFGLPPADGMASAVMPAYAGVLTNDDMVALLEYLRATFTDLPPWTGLGDIVADTRSGRHKVAVRPSDMIERAPAHLGAEEQPWRQVSP